MSVIAIALAAASGMVHAVWNLWAKRADRPLVFLWSFQWIAVAAYGPAAAWELWWHPVPGVGLPWLAGAVALHAGYVLLLARSYSAADFSAVYPLTRGIAPLAVPLLGVALLGEHMPAAGWAGILLIVSGVLATGDRAGAVHRRVLLLGLAVGGAIAAYTVVDKLALQYVPAIALNALANAGNLLALTPAALRTRAVRATWTEDARLVTAAGILSPLSYLLFLWALSHGPVAAIAPLRSLGIVFGALLGIVVLREPHGRRRLLGAAVITAGAIVLGIAG